jgi:hypothetical protein
MEEIKIKTITDTRVVFKEKIRNILTQVYDEELIDIVDVEHYYKDAARNSVKIIIHFPKVVIKNKSKSHELKDLYVCMVICPYNDTWKMTYLTGFRMSKTLAEINTQYSHSHLPYCSYNNENMFCTGTSGTPLNRALNHVNSSPKFDFNMFKYYLHLIKNYVKWESSAGVPHIRMSTLNSFKFTKRCKRKLTSIDYMCKQICKYTRPVKSFDIVTNKNKLNNINIHLDVEKIVRYINSIYRTTYLVYQHNLTGMYMSSTPETIDYDKVNKLHIIFKGEKRYFKILDQGTESSGGVKQVLHPQLELGLKRILKTIIKKNLKDE